MVLLSFFRVSCFSKKVIRNSRWKLVVPLFSEVYAPASIVTRGVETLLICSDDGCFSTMLCLAATVIQSRIEASLSALESCDTIKTVVKSKKSYPGFICNYWVSVLVRRPTGCRYCVCTFVTL